MADTATVDRQTAAGYLGISAGALDELIRAGIIEAIGTGKAATVSMHAIKTYLARFRAKPETAPVLSDEEQEKILDRIENADGTPLTPQTKRALDVLADKGIVEIHLHPFVHRITGYSRVQKKAA